jgi:glycosyltransferase involved in cell wall biosynthesis
VTGWVVPVGNVSALSAALEEALQSNAERMAKATRASVEELNVERFVNGLLEIYLDSMK